MSTIIFRTVAPFLASLMILFSIFVLLRGHNEPGGGFIGGLIAASALAIYGVAFGPSSVRNRMRFRPMTLAACGLLLAALSGLPSMVTGNGYLTGLWWFPGFGGFELPLSTPLLFDIGVYMVVVGTISAVVLSLEEEG